MGAVRRCGECAACQEWLLHKASAPRCEVRGKVVRHIVVDHLERDLSLACVALEPGKHGHQQSLSVSRKLRALEEAELAHYSQSRGWRLTTKGKLRAKALLKEARKPQGAALSAREQKTGER